MGQNLQKILIAILPSCFPALVSLFTALVAGFAVWQSSQADARRNKLEALKEKDSWIRAALEVAVLAGHKQGENIDKKKFALEVARKYLLQFEVQLNPLLLDALIDAEFLRLQLKLMQSGQVSD